MTTTSRGRIVRPLGSWCGDAAFGPDATIVNSARECPCSSSSFARSAATSSSRRPRKRMPQICRNASSAPRPARRSAPSSSASFTARSRPMIREAGSNAMLGAVRCSASTCEAHIRSPIATRHSPREHRRDQLVGVVTVAPADHLLGLERLSGDGVEGELPLQLRHDQDGVAVRPDHQHRQPFERHRPIAGQVHQIGRRGHDDGLQADPPPLPRPAAPAGSGDRPS